MGLGERAGGQGSGVGTWVGTGPGEKTLRVGDGLCSTVAHCRRGRHALHTPPVATLNRRRSVHNMQVTPCLLVSLLCAFVWDL